MKRMSSKPHVKISQIADAVGCHKSTVSLALRNDPRVNLRTRERIHRVAADLGYVPDAHLSELMGYLRKINEEGKPKDEVVAYVTTEPSEEQALGRLPFFRDFRSGVKKGLESLGYVLEDFSLREYEFNSKRLSDVMWNRSIRGVVVAPPVATHSFEGLDWKQFAGITLGYRLQVPRLHRVVCDQIRAVEMVLENLENAGYTHPLFAYRKGRDRHVGRRWSVSLKGNIGNFKGLDTYSIYSGDPDEDFVKYCRESGADCVIGLSYQFAAILEENGVKIPGDVGVALLDSHDGPSGFSGINQRPDSLGVLAARQIASLLARHDLGVPDTPFTLSLEPDWVEGGTL